MNNAVILKKGKEKAILNRHHWIFSGAVKSMPGFEDGSILPVLSEDERFLGQAYFNKRSAIVGRMISFDDSPAGDTVKENIRKAIDIRSKFFGSGTNAFRIINGEGDSLPGLIADKYDDVIVLQINTLGMEKLKPLVVDTIKEALSPACIYEKSKLPSRREEGLPNFEGVLHGKVEGDIEISENGMRFLVKLPQSQKTGFYLDQREMRKLAGTHAGGRSVLNCFSYTGGFTVYALKGGAKRADSVDESEEAIKYAAKNVELNGYSTDTNDFYIADVFEFLRDTNGAYDFIILDPPAFAKRKTDVVKACRGYKDINRIALKKILKGGLLMTFSCSYHIDEVLFQKVVFQAAVEAGRNVRIIQKHRLAYDHPVNICHPESNYLKGFLLYIE